MNEIAEQTYNTWLEQDNLPSNILNELQNMKNDPKEIEDAFATHLSFGTAGMRGLIGAGTNRMNIYTVRQAAEGLARFMDTLDDATKNQGVAISFDSRYFSSEFAHESARVLGHHGIPTYVFDDMRPTPELSFAVRHLHTYAGIMITASHNPKEYNGFKLYGPDGGQMPPKESDLITTYINKANNLFDIRVSDEHTLRMDNIMHIIGEDVDIPYLEGLKNVTINNELVKTTGKDLKFVYTPLHGTGKVIARRALNEVGFTDYEVVAEQAIADPEFPTTPHPNPEFPEAFNLAMELGQKTKADILIATDPDSDRLGAAVRQPDNTYKLLSGNQIASVLLNYILNAKKQSNTLPTNGAIVKSIVSTELADAIAKSYNVETKSVLTGFKFIAQSIQEFEDQKDHTFLFGFEESFGYLINPFVRDKDAIQAVLLLAEVAAYYKDQGKTLYDGVQEMYQKYGYFDEKTISKVLTGLDGKQKIQSIMQNFRDHPITELNGHQVVRVADYAKQTLTFDDGHTESLTLPTADVLKYWLDDDTWVAIRPSGTEPKIKFYVGTKSDSQKSVQEKLVAYENAIADLVNPLL
ncbi:phospho-sugar mutase [Lentilactobacillus laojiaonis]|uniref:phospho-sugar mutase n=1 Tax=Lentilactobacillus laojiaonis TaxID=2883998 RepID=UPI001D09F8FA|nr:phospho-sugar mutase [Lentilactobacillus laojiaonis]UDM32237.1 phospho-sugar mutase [Lentilactobacillus laojiaonis]